ncbi:MAG: Ig-like domain-containing protein [Spirochaetaceae bacterium]|nr:Ig-like domain-containing protein [Spirochaetaceae bacterium]
MTYIKKIMMIIAALAFVLDGVVSCENNWMVDSLLGKKSESGNSVALSSLRIEGSGERGGGVGTLITLSAMVEPENAADTEIIWESDAPDVAAVGRNSGIVTLLREGDARITAKTSNGRYSDSRTVRVRNTVVEAAGLSLDRNNIEGIAQDIVVLNAVVEPSDATDKGVSWTSMNESVAKVVNGMVILAAPGTTVITAKDMSRGTFLAGCMVTVTAVPVEVYGVRLNKSLIVGADSGTINLIATVYPGNAANQTLTWHSSDERIATVSDGVVTLKSLGNATITVRTEDGSKTARCQVKALDKTSADLKIKFQAQGADDVVKVSDTFTQIHNYLQGRDPVDVGAVIALGDYIDLPGLTVAGYPVDDDRPEYGKIRSITDPSQLRLLVVGINSFNGQGLYGGSGNMEPMGPDPVIPHIVMQFAGCPGNHRREKSATNKSYKTSELKVYLAGAFSDGLKNAGVPLDNDQIIWAPKRYMSNRGTLPNFVDLIHDKLWIPTVWELTGSQNPPAEWENEANQARLEYYTGPQRRKKFTDNNIPYWLASPYRQFTTTVFVVASNGSIGGNNLRADDIGGVAPAFCVK